MADNVDSAAVEQQTPSEKFWLEKSQAYVSNFLQLVGNGIDGFVSRDQHIVENESFARLRLNYTFFSQQKGEFQPELHGRLDLPKTQQRVKVFFDSTSDDVESLFTQNRENPNKTISDPVEENEASAGLRWIVPIWEQWQPSIDVGARTNIPIDPFIRTRTRYYQTIGQDWQFYTGQQVSYFHRKGLIGKHQFVFGYALSASLFWLNTFEFQWHKKDRTLENDIIISLTHQVSAKDTLTYRIAEFYQIYPQSYPSNYLADVRYRRQLKWTWLFAELIPGINWPREQNYRRQFSLTARLEVLFKN